MMNKARAMIAAKLPPMMIHPKRVASCATMTG